MARASSGMDLNGKIAALLRDFAAIQKSKQSMWGYKRAASAVLALEEPIESLLQADGTLRKIPNIGPSSTRVILEVLQTGTSATVERAIAESGKTGDIDRRPDLPNHFLTPPHTCAATSSAAHKCSRHYATRSSPGRRSPIIAATSRRTRRGATAANR